jgi:LysM repeat protein
MSSNKSFYIVKKGDTLSEIAQRYGTTSKQLSKINGIKHPDIIKPGQIIALKAKAVCKVTVVLIDKDRNPIPNAKVRLKYNNKDRVRTSRRNGQVPTILTQTPDDIVKTYIARLCKIRTTLDTDSDLNWTPIPEKVGRACKIVCVNGLNRLRISTTGETDGHNRRIA